MIRELRWLHLSDLHCRAHGDPFSQETLYRALVADLKSRVDEFGALHFVLISGDVAFSGKAEEYLAVRELLDELASAINVPTDMMFAVPGNHDVDREAAVYQYYGVRARLVNQAEVDRFLGKRAEVDHLLSRQGEFWGFERSLHSKGSRAGTPDGLGYCATVDVDGFVVAVTAVNTA